MQVLELAILSPNNKDWCQRPIHVSRRPICHYSTSSHSTRRPRHRLVTFTDFSRTLARWWRKSQEIRSFKEQRRRSMVEWLSRQLRDREGLVLTIGPISIQHWEQFQAIKASKIAWLASDNYWLTKQSKEQDLFQESTESIEDVVLPAIWQVRCVQLRALYPRKVSIWKTYDPSQFTRRLN